MDDITISINGDNSGGDPVYVQMQDGLKRIEPANPPKSAGTNWVDMGVIEEFVVVSDSRRPNGKKPFGRVDTD